MSVISINGPWLTAGPVLYVAFILSEFGKKFLGNLLYYVFVWTTFFKIYFCNLFEVTSKMEKNT